MFRVHKKVVFYLEREVLGFNSHILQSDEMVYYEC